MTKISKTSLVKIFLLCVFQQPVKAPTAVSTVVTGQSIFHDVSAMITLLTFLPISIKIYILQVYHWFKSD